MTRFALILLALAVASPAFAQHWAYQPAPRGEALLRNAVLASHNRERAAHGAQPLRWSEALAAHAASYAAVLAHREVLEHDPTPGRRKVEGENLWMGLRGAFSYQVILATMSGEGPLFRPGRFPDVSRTGRWIDVSHYSQIVWPATSEVGCAVVSGARFDVLVCRYSPPGNKDGKFVN